MTRTSDEHRQRFELLRRRLSPRVRLEVRDVQQALGLSSTSLAFAEMKAWIEMKLVDYDPPENGKRYGTYFLKRKDAEQKGEK